MKIIFYYASLLLLLFPLQLRAQYVLDPDKLSDGLDALLARHTSQDNFRGQIVVNHAGKIIYANNNGQANFATRRPLTDTTRFAIASVTKVFTAAGILLLEQDGKLRLEEPVMTYLQAFSKFPEVTVEHLVTHCSGISYGSWKLRETLGITNEEEMTYATMLDWIGREYKPLYFPPGEKRNYSNIAYNVLGALIEQVSGLQFPDFMRQRLFEPLGMSTAEIRPVTLLEDRPGYALPYIMKDKGRKVKPYTFGKDHLSYSFPNSAIGSYGIYISMRDLSKLRALWGSDLLLSKFNRNRLTEYGTLGNGEKNYYRYGYTISTTPVLKAKNIRMAGNLLGFVSFVIYYPDYDLSICLATNYYLMHNKTYVSPEMIDFYGELKPILYQAFGVEAETQR